MKINNLALVFALTTAGCATPYVQPPLSEASSLRVAVPQSKMLASVQVRGYPSGKCEDPMDLGMIGGIARLSEEVSIGIPGTQDIPQNARIERHIPAGSSYMLSVRSLTVGKECLITAKFPPVRGENYEALLLWDAGKCYLRIRRVAINALGEVVRTEVPDLTQESACSKGLN